MIEQTKRGNAAWFSLPMSLRRMLSRTRIGVGDATCGAATGNRQRKAQAMKTVLFCGGLGTRIRDVSESIPKPMIPIGDKPILWHLMHYYSQYGHKDFVLCLGYKANVIKEFFLNYKPQTYADCVVSGFGQTSRDPRRSAAGLARHDDRHRHLAQHRRAAVGRARARRGRGNVLRQLQRRPLRRQSAGNDRDIPRERQGRLLPRGPAVIQPASGRNAAEAGRSAGMRASQDANLWINGGFFIFRKEIFDYMREGEELVEAPFQRLIEADQLMAIQA